MGWEEVGPGCLRRRYRGFDLNVGLVRGRSATLLIDTRAGLREAAELAAELGAIGVAAPDIVVNTHAHFDHCFGNAHFAGVPLWGHASVPAALAGIDRAELAAAFPEWAAATRTERIPIVAPDRLVRDRAVLDLGDRLVELRFLGRGHTGGDLVVVVPDAGVIYAGDLVEEGAPPAYGDDSFPLDWPATAARLAALAGAGTGTARARAAAGAVVVPGHGDVVDAGFAAEQARLIGRVADEIRAAYASGVGVAEALAASRWPCPRELLRDAVERGYAHLAGGSPD